MPHIRSIKPDFFLDEDLARLSLRARLAFPGLWILADREGRLPDKPGQIRVQIFPYEPEVDMDAVLDELHDGGFITRYEAEGVAVIGVCNFLRHQRPNLRETQSTLPPEPAHVHARADTSGNVQDLHDAGAAPQALPSLPSLSGSVLPDPNPDQTRARDPSPTCTITGHALLRWYAEERSKAVEGSLPWTTPRASDGKASSFAEQIADVPEAEIRATMAEHFARLKRPEAAGKEREALKNPTFGFGHWSAAFTALREAIIAKHRKPAQTAPPKPPPRPPSEPITPAKHREMKIAAGMIKPSNPDEEAIFQRAERERESKRRAAEQAESDRCERLRRERSG